MARSLPVENLLSHNVGPATFSNANELAQSASHNCSQPQPAMDNGICRSSITECCSDLFRRLMKVEKQGLDTM